MPGIRDAGRNGGLKPGNVDENPEDTYRSMFLLNPQPMIVFDRETLRILDGNHAALKLYGYAATELRNLTLQEITCPEDIPLLIREMERDPGNTRGAAGLVRHRNNNLEPFYVELSFHKILFKGITINILIINDVTGRVMMECRLRESADNLKFAIEGSSAGYWERDVKSNKVTYSSSFYSLLGYAKNEIPDDAEAFKAIMHPDDREKAFEKFSLYLDGKLGQFEDEQRLLAKDGSYKWVLCRAKIVSRDAQGYPGKVVGLNTDINSLKEYELFLSETLRKEKELNELKSRFMAMVSHELMRPVSSAGLALDMLILYRDRLDEQAMDGKLTAIRSNLAELVEMVDKLLNLGKLESGETSLHRVSTDLCLLVRDVVAEIHKGSKPNREVRFVSHVSSCVTEVDRFLMRLVLKNLLSNALKYSPTDTHVEVSLSICDQKACLAVKDQGMGILPEDYDTIFDPFRRGSNTLQIPGSGIGLSIVREIARLHGFDITFVSTPGYGSTFTLQLPLDAQSQAARHPGVSMNG